MQWVKVPGFHRYSVNRRGDIISNARKNPHLLRPCIGKAGYMHVSLADDSGKYRYSGTDFLDCADVIRCPDLYKTKQKCDCKGLWGGFALLFGS